MSKEKIIQDLKNGTIRKHNLIDSNALPFSEKRHLHGFSRMLKTKNYTYVLECKGIQG